MTITSSLNASVSGLASNASRLATISDNIANASTFGYKRKEADFQSIVVSSSGGSYSAGGVLGSAKRIIDQRGPIVTTQNATDLAVRGRGFLPVAQASQVANANSSNQMYLTTTGSFRPNADGILTTDSGLVLLGWPALADGTIPSFPRDTSDALVPVQVNMNELLGEPTTNITLGINLPATATESTAAGTSLTQSVEYFDNLGKSSSIEMEFTPTIPGTGASNEWTLTLRDAGQAGAVVGEYTLTFNDTPTERGTPASIVPIGTSPAYDSATGSVIITAASGPIEITLGNIDERNGMTQLSDEFAPVAITKDGFEVGRMTSIEVDPNGFVRALFDTGITRTIYQVPLVDMPNPNGMIALDAQTYSPSPDSGNFFLWDVGDGSVGDIVAFAREQSATDVAGELTDMIQTQRAYTSNAKVIQTVDEMLQETTNIIR